MSIAYVQPTIPPNTNPETETRIFIFRDGNLLMLFVSQVGHADWRTSVKQLCSEPAVILVFRGLHCTQRIKDIITAKLDRHEKVSYL